MKDKAVSVASEGRNQGDSYNRLREYLQHVVLRALFEQNALKGIVFHGGTALRIIYDLGRFSEDLDFHVDAGCGFDLKKISGTLKRSLELQGYAISLKNSSSDAVKSSFIKFGSILTETGLGTREGEKLNIKLEVDMNPPAGFATEHSLINKYFPLAVIHHDAKTFFAGKLHAVFQRSYIKGRDYYDLWFYLGRWKGFEPNLKYLNNALEQTGYKGDEITVDNWKTLLAERIGSVNWKAVSTDIEPFLENPGDVRIFNKDFFLQMLK